MMNNRYSQPTAASGIWAGWLVAVCLYLLAGCGRESGKPGQAGTVKATQAELQTVDQELVDLLAPEATGASGTGGSTSRLRQRERDAARQLLALAKRRDDVVREQTQANPEVLALHRQMTEAREAYQRQIAALPEVAGLDHQIDLLRKQLQEMRSLADKLNEENQP